MDIRFIKVPFPFLYTRNTLTTVQKFIENTLSMYFDNTPGTTRYNLTPVTPP